MKSEVITGEREVGDLDEIVTTLIDAHPSWISTNPYLTLDSHNLPTPDEYIVSIDDRISPTTVKPKL